MAPPMPAGFTDRTAWDAIHWKFKRTPTGELTSLSGVVLQWQLDHQERVWAAIQAIGEPSPAEEVAR